MRDHVAGLAALLDDQAIEGAIVCGLSVGGLIAQGLYASRPELASGLVLCDTAHKVGTAEMWNTRSAAIEKGGLASIAEAILARWFSRDLRDNEIGRASCRERVCQDV